MDGNKVFTYCSPQSTCICKGCMKMTWDLTRHPCSVYFDPGHAPATCFKYDLVTSWKETPGLFQAWALPRSKVSSKHLVALWYPVYRTTCTVHRKSISLWKVKNLKYLLCTPTHLAPTPRRGWDVQHRRFQGPGAELQLCSKAITGAHFLSTSVQLKSSAHYFTQTHDVSARSAERSFSDNTWMIDHFPSSIDFRSAGKLPYGCRSVANTDSASRQKCWVARVVFPYGAQFGRRARWAACQYAVRRQLRRAIAPRIIVHEYCALWVFPDCSTATVYFASRTQEATV